MKQDYAGIQNVMVKCHKAGALVDPRTIKRRALKLLNALCPVGAELSILLCNDAFIRELNGNYRGKFESTDVLSFAMQEEEKIGARTGILGDVVISVETARMQALSANRSTMDEVTSLLIHGVLHLLGYLHDTKESEEEMFQKADELESLVLEKKKSRP